MTKQEEIHNLKEIIAGLPAQSYLASTLRHIAVQFEQDIRSDFLTLPDLAAINREIASQNETSQKLANALSAKRAEVAALEGRAAAATRAIEQAKEKLREVARTVIDYCDGKGGSK